ncbi:MULTISPECIES: pyridoxamine 5'-phosphate oxidase family protein [Calothrix]|uniref:Pyridoxamine 5'-phosphate oxidase family protein n=2 Tax=Calothrix TaxID=1186 RepID=A0ABR8AM62_9CYAN|nr:MULTISPECIES: pyridoxamine 5'-phosphate oxidase family protein [Calothrix]MBD2200640.1 pyridoxamine 5'-phosphate oxidase family protein [Calothrix parietina FACHB-288]MBD2229673.1 pyridoxamine 5'-phosphate oxidase family protein [Calothrix anomala FACHB-343]
MSFHSGEIKVQTQAGVREEAQLLCHIISSTIKPSAHEFLSTQQIVVASTVDTNGRVWTSLLTEQPGFIKVLNPQTIQIDAIPIQTDPLHQNLQSNNDIGLLVIDLAKRRRLRLNGKAKVHQENIKVEIQQAFFNCPKYIQVRHIEKAVTDSLENPQASINDALNKTNQLWITQADTFFIASYHPESGADASHRGGFPGFVQVVNSNQLVFPDYSGNNMFQTFGNLSVNPNAGLLFIDFVQGHILQLTGKAKIIWDAERLGEFAGAQRLVEFDIEQVLESKNAFSLRWRFGEYSPFNPG